MRRIKGKCTKIGAQNPAPGNMARLLPEFQHGAVKIVRRKEKKDSSFETGISKELSFDLRGCRVPDAPFYPDLFWCGHGDSNPNTSLHENLNLACLPIPSCPPVYGAPRRINDIIIASPGTARKRFTPKKGGHGVSPFHILRFPILSGGKVYFTSFPARRRAYWC